RAGTGPIGIQTAQRIYYAARNAAGIAPEGGNHGLRHAPDRGRRRSSTASGGCSAIVLCRLPPVTPVLPARHFAEDL
ncbi:MAG TPA: hypothetical protein PLS39_14760, partial [Accumulibacter sp.]|nr:hypothetical protein [Accumulibacter sp.]